MVCGLMCLGAAHDAHTVAASRTKLFQPSHEVVCGGSHHPHAHEEPHVPQMWPWAVPSASGSMMSAGASFWGA